MPEPDQLFHHIRRRRIEEEEEEEEEQEEEMVSRIELKEGEIEDEQGRFNVSFLTFRTNRKGGKDVGRSFHRFQRL